MTDISEYIPRRLPLTLVTISVHLLPATHRNRYRAEFTAELHDLSPAAQWRYAGRVLGSAISLRGALDGVAPAAAVHLPTRGPSSPLHCRVLFWHHWEIASAEDGSSRFHRCRDCGRERFMGSSGRWTGFGAGGA